MSQQHLPEYRRIVTNALISDFSALQHEDGDTLFQNVGKLLIEEETSFPICELFPSNVTVNEDGLNENARVLGYNMVITENIEKTSNALADLAIDRISRAEDIVIEYLEKIPQGIDNINVPADPPVSEYDIKVTKISDISGQWIPQAEGTIVISFVLRFNAYTEILIK